MTQDFVAIDFETANPKRVSACSVGLAVVRNGKVVSSESHLVCPVGGHHDFQTRIHGITDEMTSSAPNFGDLYPTLEAHLSGPLIGYSLFDKQVLNALVKEFDLALDFAYEDTCKMAKSAYPQLRNHKLKTVARHVGLRDFNWHDAEEDALACAEVFLTIARQLAPATPSTDDHAEFVGLAKGILADGIVNYKEAYSLLYWLEDHPEVAMRWPELFRVTSAALADGRVDEFESEQLRALLSEAAR